jgi:hypothetical protein
MRWLIGLALRAGKRSIICGLASGTQQVAGSGPDWTTNTLITSGRAG